MKKLINILTLLSLLFFITCNQKNAEKNFITKTLAKKLNEDNNNANFLYNGTKHKEFKKSIKERNIKNWKKYSQNALASLAISKYGTLLFAAQNAIASFALSKYISLSPKKLKLACLKQAKNNILNEVDINAHININLNEPKSSSIDKNNINSSIKESKASHINNNNEQNNAVNSNSHQNNTSSNIDLNLLKKEDFDFKFIEDFDFKFISELTKEYKILKKTEFEGIKICYIEDTLKKIYNTIKKNISFIPLDNLIGITYKGKEFALLKYRDYAIIIDSQKTGCVIIKTDGPNKGKSTYINNKNLPINCNSKKDHKEQKLNENKSIPIAIDSSNSSSNKKIDEKKLKLAVSREKVKADNINKKINENKLESVVSKTKENNINKINEKEDRSAYEAIYTILNKSICERNNFFNKEIINDENAKKLHYILNRSSESYDKLDISRLDQNKYACSKINNKNIKIGPISINTTKNRTILNILTKIYSEKNKTNLETRIGHLTQALEKEVKNPKSSNNIKDWDNYKMNATDKNYSDNINKDKKQKNDINFNHHLSSNINESNKSLNVIITETTSASDHIKMNTKNETTNSNAINNKEQKENNISSLNSNNDVKESKCNNNTAMAIIPKYNDDTFRSISNDEEFIKKIIDILKETNNYNNHKDQSNAILETKTTNEKNNKKKQEKVNHHNDINNSKLKSPNNINIANNNISNPENNKKKQEKVNLNDIKNSNKKKIKLKSANNIDIANSNISNHENNKKKQENGNTTKVIKLKSANNKNKNKNKKKKYIKRQKKINKDKVEDIFKEIDKMLNYYFWWDKGKIKSKAHAGDDEQKFKYFIDKKIIFNEFKDENLNKFSENLKANGLLLTRTNSTCTTQELNIIKSAGSLFYTGELFFKTETKKFEEANFISTSWFLEVCTKFIYFTFYPNNTKYSNLSFMNFLLKISSEQTDPINLKIFTNKDHEDAYKERLKEINYKYSNSYILYDDLKSLFKAFNCKKLKFAKFSYLGTYKALTKKATREKKFKKAINEKNNLKLFTYYREKENYR